MPANLIIWGWGEHNELKNRFMHVDFKGQKPTIDAKKAKIELAVEESSFNKTAKENLVKFIRGIELDEIFGHSRVMEIVGCGSLIGVVCLEKIASP